MSENFRPLSAAHICAKLKTAAKSGKKMIILSHQNPDGDTVASAFALKLLYNAMAGGDLARCVCTADAAPYLHHFYRGQDSIAYIPGEERNADLIIAVDVATPKQLGKLQFLASRVDFMIDHHEVGTPFADYYTVPTASAAGELVWNVYENLMIDGLCAMPDVSRLIYAAISADTGSFRYSNTTPDTMNIAANLLREINYARDGGEDTAEIARILHENTTMGELCAQRLAIDNLKFAGDGRLSYVIFTAEMLENNGLTELDIGGIVDLPRSIEGVQIGITVKQNRTDPHQFRISSRANGGADVAKVCAVFGGGGHKKAAGATVTAQSPAAAEEMIVREFSKALI